MKRLLIGLGLSCAIAATIVVVLRAEEGPYNSNPPFCRDHTMLNPLWWYYECMYPDDPTWGQVPG